MGRAAARRVAAPSSATARRSPSPAGAACSPGSPTSPTSRATPRSPCPPTTGGRFALCGARATTAAPARYGPAEGVGVELRGAGQASRQVNNFCTPATFEADKLIAVEVLTPGGNWSSYPPHKHDEERPGRGAAGGGLLLRGRPAVPTGHARHGLPAGLRAPGRARRSTCAPRSAPATSILIPHGWHGPAMATPGYDLYYLNVMAGPGPERAWLICDDPAHAWIRGTWEGQEIDPRLPLTSTERPTKEARPLRTITHWIGGKPASRVGGAARARSGTRRPARSRPRSRSASTDDVDAAVPHGRGGVRALGAVVAVAAHEDPVQRSGRW